MLIQQQLHRLLAVKDQRLHAAEQRLKQERDRRAAQEADLQRCRQAHVEAETKLQQFRAELCSGAVTKTSHSQVMAAISHAEWMHFTVKSRDQDVVAAGSKLAALDRAVIAAEFTVQAARREREKTVRQCDAVAARVRAAVERRHDDELQEFLEISSQRARQQKVA